MLDSSTDSYQCSRNGEMMLQLLFSQSGLEVSLTVYLMIT